MVEPTDAGQDHADNILIPHHTTAMAATMQANVRARSRTWIFMVSIPFFYYPAWTLCDSTMGRQRRAAERPGNGERGTAIRTLIGTFDIAED